MRFGAEESLCEAKEISVKGNGWQPERNARTRLWVIRPLLEKCRRYKKRLVTCKQDVPRNL